MRGCIFHFVLRPLENVPVVSFSTIYMKYVTTTTTRTEETSNKKNKKK
jgi:hypothetical protein